MYPYIYICLHMSIYIITLLQRISTGPLRFAQTQFQAAKLTLTSMVGSGATNFEVYFGISKDPPLHGIAPKSSKIGWSISWWILCWMYTICMDTYHVWLQVLLAGHLFFQRALGVSAVCLGRMWQARKIVRKTGLWATTFVKAGCWFFVTHGSLWGIHLYTAWNIWSVYNKKMRYNYFDFPLTFI